MSSKEDEAFIEYWEKNRLKRKKLVRQFLLGIPLGLLITVPTVIWLTAGWYKAASVEANSADFDPRVLFVAFLLIIAFTAIFWQRHQWDQHEQHYHELLARRARRDRNPDTTQKAPEPPQSPPSTQPQPPETHPPAQPQPPQKKE